MKASRDETDDRLRLLQQARAGEGFRYYFMLRKLMLTITISPRAGADDPAEWKVEVRAGQGLDEVVVANWGQTRDEALSDAGAAWATQSAAVHLPRFDWEIVTEALRSVRAV